MKEIQEVVELEDSHYDLTEDVSADWSMFLFGDYWPDINAELSVT